jgi:prepilin-type processing-associated H-X9-DG protein
MNIRVLSAGRFARLLCVLLAIAMATGPSAAVLAQTNAAQQAVRKRVEGLGGNPADRQPQPQLQRGAGDRTLLASETAGKIDTTYVTPAAIAIIVLRPAQIMSSPMAEMLPTEVATAAGLKYLGIDPAAVDEIVVFIEQPNPAAAPGYGVTIKFNKPFKGSSIPPELRAHAQLSEFNGKRYLQSQHPMMPSFYGPDNKTLVLAPDATLRQLIEFDGAKSGPIIDRVRNVPAGGDLYAGIDVASLRPLIQMGLGMAQSQVPPEAQGFLEAPNLILATELTVNISGPGPTSFVVHANDDSAAEQLETLLAEASKMQQEKLKAQFAQQAASDDPIERAMAQYAERVSGRWSQPFMPTREGASLTFFRFEGQQSAQQQMTIVAVTGIAVALLLPAVQAAREAARRNQSMNNLKNLSLSLLFHESTKKSLPAHAIYSSDGKPLLSWRVQVLPYIEEQALYEQFHLDEPWDSEHNKTLIPRMPQVYQSPNATIEPGKTNYLAVVGKECIFNGSDKGMQLKQVTDGTSNTITVVEADAEQAVEWTKPDDCEFDPDNPSAGLGKLRPGGWNAAFADGHVQFISNSIDPQTLKALFTATGGEAIAPGQY